MSIEKPVPKKPILLEYFIFTNQEAHGLFIYEIVHTQSWLVIP